MNDSLEKKSIGEMVDNMPFDQLFRHFRVVERLCFLDFDKHSSLFIQLLHTYICYKYCLNEYRMFLFSIYTENKYNITFF